MNVLIAGDFCDRYRISDLIARGNYASLFDDIKYLTEQADVSIINFEFPIVLHAGVPITKSGPTLQGQPAAVDAVKAELEAYKESLSANDLYAEFADKVALAKDARIVTNGNYVAIVIAGIANPDYAPIDTALETALNF